MSRYQGPRQGLGFQKPENALKRAEELCNVGQRASALQALHDIITSKRHRTWAKILEQIMFRYVELCVELKKGRYAKDGLIHYRNVCQQVNVSSLEEVIKHFLKTATDKAEDAQSKAEAATIAVEDLELDATPEDLMLSYVSGEKGKDRTDREMVTPWFKFLWETYRSTLDILRNNSRLEALYAMVAVRAFQFCQTYKRNTEFRRLCDILRNHLANLNKYRDQRDRPDLTNPESLQLYLESRFEQLRVACDMELWQEAYRSVEDIQGLIAIGKSKPKPQMQCTYYARLTRIFTVSDSQLFNGYAWHRLFTLTRQFNKGLTAADTQGMAASVLLAALAIPRYDASETEGEAALHRERTARMAGILGYRDFQAPETPQDLNITLTRRELLAELQGRGIPALVPEEVRQILGLLEVEFAPLDLCHRLQPLLGKLASLSGPLSAACPIPSVDLAQFTESLQNVAVVRMVEQLSQVYSRLHMSALASMVPFYDIHQTEKIIVEAIKHDYLHVRFDHQSRTVHFDAWQSQAESARQQLATLAAALGKAVGLIKAEEPAHAARTHQLIADAQKDATHVNDLALARKTAIERRKEQEEQRLLQAEELEHAKRVQIARQTEAAEEDRRRADRVRREEERIQAELQEREEEEARRLLAEAVKKGGAKALKLKEGEKLDKRAVQEVVLSEQSRARDEAEKRMQRLMKQLDYLERARREEEAPLLEANHKKQVDLGEVAHEKDQDQFAVTHRSDWEKNVAEKQRLSRMLDAKDTFGEQIQTRRAEEFEALRREREARIAAKLQQRREERDLRRKQEYTRRCLTQLEVKRLKEEEEEAERLEIQKKREAEENARRLEEQAEKQRKRAEEMAAQKAKEREAILAAERAERVERAAPTPAPAAAEAARPGGGAYVPAFKRAQGAPGPAAPATGGSWRARSQTQPAAEAAAAPAAGGGWKRERPVDPPPSTDRWQPRTASRDEPAPAPRAGPPAADGESRWSRRSDSGAGRPGDSFGPSRRDAPPSGDSFGPSRRDAPPGDGPPRPSGAYRPPAGRERPAERAPEQQRRW